MNADGTRNLVVCCDGTGNVWRAGGGQTNVVRLVQALHPDPTRQLVFYDPGVGTSAGLGADSGGLSWRDRLRRAAGLAWGLGVWTNVAQAYLFLVEHYRPGDRIFLFGFSRGAFTARAVGGLIHLCGLMERGHENLVPALMQTYRMRESAQRREAGDSFKQHFARPGVEVWFTGVWDTVESVGIASILLGAHITSNREVKLTYRHVRHAVALDELRAPYTPRLYDTPQHTGPGHSFEQVHFAGAHCDVGGSYPEDGLANAAWHWMLREANSLGLLVRAEAFERHPQHHADTLHDETVGFPPWVLAGAFTRALPTAPMKVHETVQQRMAQPDCAYAPELPDQVERAITRAEVVHPDGSTHKMPVPVKPDLQGGPPRRERPGWRHALCLAAAAVATAVAYGTMAPVQQQLAMLQLWRRPFFELGGAIEPLIGGATDRLNSLLFHDGLLILAYTVMVAFALLLLLRWSRRGDAVGPALGRLARAGAAMPLADALENWATQAAWSAHVATSCSPLGCHWVEGLYSLLASLASFTKFAAMAVLVMMALGCLASRLVSKTPAPRR